MNSDPVLEELWQIKDELSEQVGADFSNLPNLLEFLKEVEELGPIIDPSEKKKSA